MPTDLVRRQSAPAAIVQKRDRGNMRDQLTAPWGIARLTSGVNQLEGRDPLVTNFNYTYDTKFTMFTQAYVIDTGCNNHLTEFQGRAKFIAAFAGSAVDDLNDVDGREYPYPRILLAWYTMTAW